MGNIRSLAETGPVTQPPASFAPPGCRTRQSIRTSPRVLKWLMIPRVWHIACTRPESGEGAMKTKITSIDAGVKRHRADLESKLGELLQLSAGHEDLEIQPMPDPADQVRANSDRDMAVEALNQRACSIHEIREALARIAEDGYGRCERCEMAIP